MTSSLFAILFSIASVSMVAQPGAGSTPTAAATTAVAINTHCPVSREPVDKRHFATHQGRQIAFCCPGCQSTFAGWTDQRRDAFITATLHPKPATPEKSPPQKPASPPPAQEPEPAEAEDEVLTWAAAYPLSTCPITNRKLGSMGDPVSKVIDGREVRFCCAPCIPKFEADKQARQKLEARIIAAQLPLYPLETCVVAGGRLGSMGEPDNYVYRNRLVRFCCASCRGKFDKDPAGYLKKLDAAAAEKQGKDYPLTTCVVTGEPLGSMGDPAEVILGGRLIRLCCAPCDAELRKDPARFIEMVDNARKPAK